MHVKRENVALSQHTRSQRAGRAGRHVKRIAFAPTVPLPSYLIAFAVGPFEIVDAGRAGKNGVPVRISDPSRASRPS